MEGELEEEYVRQFIIMQKANNKYMKDYNKNKDLMYLKYCDVNNIYGWVMPQNLCLDILKGHKKLINLMTIS